MAKGMMSATGVVIALMLLSSTVVFGQQPTQEDQEVLQVVKAAVVHLRPELRGPLYIGVEDWSHDAIERSRVPAIAQALDAEGAEFGDVFDCEDQPTGTATCRGEGVFVTQGAPVFEDGRATIWIHYTQARPDGGVPVTSVLMLLEPRGDSWHVVRELGRKFSG